MRKDQGDLAAEERQEAGGGHLAQDHGARRAAVGDGPADEVGVGLVAEALFGQVAEGREGGGVRGALEGLEDGGADAEGEVEFADGAFGEVVLDHEVDFGAEGLGLGYGS